MAMQISTIGKDGGSIERNRPLSPISVNSENAVYTEPINQINAEPMFINAPKSRKVTLAQRTHVETKDNSDASSVSSIKSSLLHRSISHLVSKFTL